DAARTTLDVPLPSMMGEQPLRVARTCGLLRREETRLSCRLAIKRVKALRSACGYHAQTLHLNGSLCKPVEVGVAPQATPTLAALRPRCSGRRRAAAPSSHSRRNELFA